MKISLGLCVNILYNYSHSQMSIMRNLRTEPLFKKRARKHLGYTTPLAVLGNKSNLD